MYDIIGDIHGCATELRNLLTKLGYFYVIGEHYYAHPRGRKAVFVGDLCDRGPNTPGVFSIVQTMVQRGSGLCVMGNHDNKFMRYLKGNKVKISKGMQATIAQMDYNDIDLNKILKFLETLPCKMLLDNNNLLVCHAGLKEKYHLAEENKKIASKCYYGETTGAIDDSGFPVRLPWQNDYLGTRIVVHGHVALDEPSIINNVYNVDTGCVFGGKLTALQYPELIFKSTLALNKYWERGIN